MRRKYKLNLFFTYITTILLAINLVIGEKLTEMALTNSRNMNKKSSKEKITDISLTGHFFQDIFSEHLAPFKIEFGHVYENPIAWEQRFESQDYQNNRHSGKVKWGNQRGEYGEQYWDLNH